MYWQTTWINNYHNGQWSSSTTTHPFTHLAAAIGMCTKFLSDIAKAPLQSPVQPRMNKFPSTTIGNKEIFNSGWYKNYKWLEYSIQNGAAFCYPCGFFATTTLSADTFTCTGFLDWKHATGQSGMLLKHDTFCSHRQDVCLCYGVSTQIIPNKVPR